MKTKAFRGIGAVVIVLVLVGILVVGGLMMAGTYNNLVGKDTLVEERASNIESQMKRRADLVPNLVATVKGYATHEKEVFDNIANARSRLLSADVRRDPRGAAEANRAFDSALGRLLAIAENYPQLQANRNFTQLQDELAGTENRINHSRLQYNEAVRDYNQAVRSFPTSLVAGMTGFERREFFQAVEGEKATPQVQF